MIVHRKSWLVMFITVLLSQHTSADGEVEKNVVYGMLSGLALTMDVYFPSKSNQLGVVVIPGSAWDGRDVGYSEWEVKGGYKHINMIRDVLVRRGFTAFVPNHRAAPVHQYPAPIEDVKRAVRFIRANADRFQINGRTLGAIGHSSGGYLCAMLGVLDETPSPKKDQSLVDRQNAKIQAVVAIDAPYDLSMSSPFIMPFVVAYMGERPPMDSQWRNYILAGRYAEASPVTHVSRDDAAFMLIHAIGDPNISVKQTENMAKVAENAGLNVKTVLISESTHTPEVDSEAIAIWLKTHLR